MAIVTSRSQSSSNYSSDGAAEDEGPEGVPATPWRVDDVAFVFSLGDGVCSSSHGRRWSYRMSLMSGGVLSAM